MLIKQLQKLDLNKNEAKVYLASLELGESSIIRIAKKANLKRTTTYGLVETLKEKGLIIKGKYRGKTSYIAESPKKIKTILEQKINIAQNVLPELLSITNVIDKKPKIKFYEGVEAIQEIHNDTLNYPDQEYLTWISEIGFYQNWDKSYWYDFYMPERKKKNIRVRAIVSDTKITRKFKRDDKEYFRQTRIDGNSDNKIEVIMLVYGKNKVAIISTDELIGLIIESKRLYITIKSLFEVHWRSLKR